MSWQLSILLHGLLSGFRTIAGRSVSLDSKKDYSLYLLLVSFLCLGVYSFTQAYLLRGSIEYELALRQWPIFVAMATGIAVYNYLFFKILRSIDASYFALMSVLYPLSVVFFSVLFRNEQLNNSQILGAVFLIGAVVILKLFANKRGKKAKVSFDLNKAFPMFIFSAVAFGIAITAEKAALDEVGLETYQVVGWGLQTVFVMIVVLLLRKSLNTKANKKTHFLVLLQGILLVTSGVMYVYSSVESDSASLTAVGSNIKVLITAVLAYVILKERDNLLLKLVCFVLSCIGLYLLFI